MPVSINARDEDHLPSELPLSFWQAFKTLFGSAIPRAMSYTFSLQVFAVALFVLKNSDHSSAEYRAAVTIITTFMDIVEVSMSFSFGAAVEMARVLGEYQAATGPDKARAKLRLAQLHRVNLPLSMLAGLIPTLAFIFSGSISRSVFRQDPVVAEIAQSYLRRYAIVGAGFGLLLRLWLELLMLLLGKTKEAMAIAVINFIGFTGLGWWLMHGSPGMGLEGLALAYALDSWGNVLCFGIYVRFQKDFRFFDFFKFSQGMGGVRAILREGWPIAISALIESSLLYLLGMMAGIKGVKEQANMSAVMPLIAGVYVASAAVGAEVQR